MKLYLGLSVVVLAHLPHVASESPLPSEPLNLQVQADNLTPTQQRADLNTLDETLRAKHPGLNRYTSDRDWSAAVQALSANLDQDCTPLELFRKLAPLVALVRCCHTSLEPPSSIFEGLTEQLFPLEVQRIGHRWWITSTPEQTPEIVPGSELLSINGKSMSSIEAKILPCLSTDGYIETGPLHSISQYLAILYALYVEHAPEKFQVTLRTPMGQELALTIQSLPLRKLQANHRSSRPYRCNFLDDDSLALLDVRYFGAKRFSSFLASTFEELDKRKTKTLILDLRDNGGGTDEDGALLCSYFFSNKFRYFDRIEVTPSYDGEVGIVDRPDGQRRVTTHSGLQQQSPTATPFRGQLFVLIDGGTFSTAADVATILHHHKRGTFLGKESGGGYDGNTSGDSSDLELPESGIHLDVQEWMYTTANQGHAHTGRGVPVDYAVEPTVADVLAGIDPCLVKVRALLEQASR